MSSELPETSLLADVAQDFVDRNWAISRISAWADDMDSPPAFLVRGGPGSGKSTLLMQYLAFLRSRAQSDNQSPPKVIATVMRHPGYQQSFDSSSFLADIVKGLAEFAPVEDVPQLAADGPQITVTQQNIGQAEQVTGVVLQLGISSISSLLALAEHRVRATPRDANAFIIVDALDQAEDEPAREFLSAFAAMVRSAAGTGVRILCASRTQISVWLEPAKRVELDLVADADDLNSELRAYLNDRFKELSEADRARVVDALLNGARGNWLWASTNASAIEKEMATSKEVPRNLSLSEGLSGLYSDGWRRIRQRVASRLTDRLTEARVKEILGAIACSFTGGLGLVEIRWATGIQPDEIRDLVHECEPFLVSDDSGNVRTFHPDFSRWLLRSPEVNISESSEHLRLARGLARLGQAMRWNDVAEKYAVPWILNHWCSVLILDPFRPDAETHERELAEILSDTDWAAHASSSLDTIEQVGLVAPRINLPHHELPLLAGLRAIQVSPATNLYMWCHVLARLEDEEVDELYALDGQREWIEEHIPDFSSITTRALWCGLLLKHFYVTETGDGLMMALRPSAVLAALDFSIGRVGHHSQIVAELAAKISGDDRTDLRDELEKRLERKPSSWAMTAKENHALAMVYQVLSAERSGEEQANYFTSALAAYTRAWEAVPPDREDRLTFAIELANALRDLPARSDEQMELLITAQAEIRDLRRRAGDPTWPASANRLGDAYRERAMSRAEQGNNEEDSQAARTEDLHLALAAYTQAWEAVQPDQEDRLTFAVDLVDTLRDLPVRSAEQMELLITVQAEIRDLRQSAGDSRWPRSANLLGGAYQERAMSRAGGTEGEDEQAAGTEDLGRALAAFRQAWEAVPPGHADRLSFATDLANALWFLPVRSAEQLELLITAATEVRDLGRSVGDARWPRAAFVLGGAYRERATSRAGQAAGEKDEQAAAEDGRRAALADLRRALAAHIEAWEAVPPDHEDRLSFAIDLANVLWALPARSAEQLELLITVQAEIRDLRRSADDPKWPQAANLLGTAHRERALSRADQAAGDKDEQAAAEDRRTAALADLDRALAAHTEAWEAVPPDHEDRLNFAIDLANTLVDLPARSAEQLELLITAATEVRDLGRSAGDARWPRAAHVLGGAYRERATSRADQAAGEKDEAKDEQATGEDSRKAALEEAALADLHRALAAHIEAWEAVPPGDADRLTFAIDLANVLWALPVRSTEELELLITTQAEIRDLRQSAGDPEWPGAANLLGRAYGEWAERLAQQGEGDEENQAARAEVLRQALTAHIEAWAAAPPGYADRLSFAIDLANTLVGLPARSAEQLELLITAATEVRDLGRSAGDARWPQAAHLLGRAYRERAERLGQQGESDEGNQAARAENLRLAVAALRQAWEEIPPDHADRLAFAIELANTVWVLPVRPAEQLELLITVQAEIRDLRQSAGDPTWPEAAHLLGTAYRERAMSGAEQTTRAEDLLRALAAFIQAWEAIPPGHADRLAIAIDLANTVRDLPVRSAEQLELLIATQAEIRDLRQSAGDSTWPESAHLLGDAYRERAMSRAEQAARAEDLRLALAAYTQAWEAIPPGSKNRVTFAIDVANTLVVQAALMPGTSRGPAVVDKALNVVSSSITDHDPEELAALRGLLPFLSARLARQRWSLI